MLIIIRVKIFCGVKFLQFAQSAKFFNSGQLQCRRMPGEFLVFSLLPGIRRARYRLMYIVVNRTFTLAGVDLRAHLFMNHHRASCFFLRI